MTEEIKSDGFLDCTGLLCPIPVVKTSRAIKTVDVGQILEMVATDPGAPPDMEAWSRQTGHELLQQTAGDGEFRFWFKRTR
jgi:tRNA 2-thiouridine synthesizing protein A